MIASNSSSEYKKTSKTPQQIGQELGVQYLVIGKVRWEKSGGGQRVQVSPELIQVSSGVARWQQPFDASITDVFQVQADIAGQVAQALNVALGAGEKQALAQKPTQNLAAYDAYLKGEEARSGWATRPGQAAPGDRLLRAGGGARLRLRRRLGPALPRACDRSTTTGPPTPATTAPRWQAAQRVAAIAPGAPETHLALGDYHNYVTGDFGEGDGGVLGRAPAGSGQPRAAGRRGHRDAEPGQHGFGAGALPSLRKLDPRSVTSHPADRAGAALAPAVSRGS